MRQVILDTETTGLEVQRGHRVIEIGCIELVQRRATGRRFHCYLNPDRSIDEGARAVTGISDDFLLDKPRFGDIAAEFLEFIDGAEVVAHNAAFDVGFLDAELARVGATQLATRALVIDTLALAREKYPGQRNSLDALCRRLGVDNQPYGRTFEVRDELAYENFAYEHSVIGSMADLGAATVDDVASFFKTYYAPNNAVLSIVGDVNTKTALEKVRKYFESIPSQPAPPAVDITEPAQKEERRTTVEDGLARLARLDMVYKTPPSGSTSCNAG